ncbi:MAG: glucose 1-dehydrogenase [Syntrophomonadaceae bacterium]|nr:glucose 1-dehydrogenase [Syntrophomonadaceae bacterium]
MKLDFTNKVVLITGGAGGFGVDAARSFASKGAKIALVDLSQEALDNVAKELSLPADDLLLVAADVAKEDNIVSYVNKTKEKFGRIDIFFNNAGIEGVVSKLADYPSDVFNKVIDINVKGAYLGMKYVLQVMREQNSGNIINVSSVAGLAGMPDLSAYVTSKFAIIGMTRSAAVENAPLGIRVNAICPAMVNTRMMRSVEEGMAGENAAQAKAAFEQTIPLGRYGEVEEISSLVMFLASEEAAFITGVFLPIDGGFTA